MNPSYPAGSYIHQSSCNMNKNDENVHKIEKSWKWNSIVFILINLVRIKDAQKGLCN